MGINSRVKQLERQAGGGGVCEVCEAISRHGAATVELINRLGIVEPKRTPALFQASCAWCLRPVTLDLSFFNLGERVLYERMMTAYRGGTLCLPENATLWEELAAAFDKVARGQYGPRYDEYREVADRGDEELNEIFARRTPALIYLCRVPGCYCKHPKTEAEWRANVKAKRMA